MERFNANAKQTVCHAIKALIFVFILFPQLSNANECLACTESARTGVSGVVSFPQCCGDYPPDPSNPAICGSAPNTLDTDGDGLPDVFESFEDDNNKNGIVDALDALTAIIFNVPLPYWVMVVLAVLLLFIGTKASHFQSQTVAGITRYALFFMAFFIVSENRTLDAQEQTLDNSINIKAVLETPTGFDLSINLQTGINPQYYNAWLEVENAGTFTKIDESLNTSNFTFNSEQSNPTVRLQRCLTTVPNTAEEVLSSTVIDTDSPVFSGEIPPSYGDDKVGSLEGSFRVNESGAATYSIPIMTATGTANVAPAISLNYSSHSGRGIAGKGWSIGGASAITRCRQTLQIDGKAERITWTNDDRFCLDGQRLLVQDSENYGVVGATYRTEIDGFVEVISVGGSAGHPDYFTVSRKDGSISHYGHNNNVSQSKQQNVSGETLTWAISQFEDSIGNPIKFAYHNDSRGFALSRIDYALGSATTSQSQTYIEFIYDAEDRSDPTIGYIAGYLFENHLRLKAIHSYGADHSGSSAGLLREYRLKYESQPATPEAKDNLMSRLISIKECEALGTCHPATTLNWGDTLPFNDTGGSTVLRSHTSMSNGNGINGFKLADINGDGLKDLVWLRIFPDNNIDQLLMYAMATETGFVPATFAQGSPPGAHGDCTDLGCIRYEENPVKGEGLTIEVIDYNADNRDDLLIFSENFQTWELYLSTPQTDGSWQLKRTSLTMPFSYEHMSFGDLNTDGLIDAWYIDASTATLYQWYLERNANLDNTNSQLYHYVAQQVKSIPLPVDSTPTDAGFIKNTIYSGSAYGGRFDGVDSISYGGSVGDFDGDGIADLSGVIQMQHRWMASFSNGRPIFATQYNTYFVVYSMNSNGEYFLNYSVAYEPEYSGSISNDHKFKANRWYRLGDINADGVTDILIRKMNMFDEEWELHLGSGDLNVFSEPIEVGAMHPFSLAEADLNGDGYLDIYWRNEDTLQVRYWQPTLQIFSTPEAFATVSASDNVQYTFADVDPRAGFELLDVNNVAGHLTVHGYDMFPDGHDNIHTITNGLGAITNITYEPLSQTNHYLRVEGINIGVQTQEVCFANAFGEGCWPVTTTTIDADEFYTQLNDPFNGLPAEAVTLYPEMAAPILEFMAPLPIVTRIESSAPRANDTTPNAVDYTAKSGISYIYHQAKIQAAGRGYLGFKKIETVDEQTGVRTSTEYRQDFPFVGTPIKTEVHTTNGELLSRSSTNWQLKSYTHGDYLPGQQNAFSDALAQAQTNGFNLLGSLQPWLKETIDTTFSTTSVDLSINPTGLTVSDDVLKTVITNNNAVDKHGNILEGAIKTYQGSHIDGSLLKMQTNTNTYTPAGWGAEDAVRYGRLSTSTVLHQRFDNAQPNITRKAAFGYYPLAAGGLLQTETVEPDNASYTLTTTYEHDTFGNQTKTTRHANNASNGANSITLPGVGNVGAAANNRYSESEYDALGRYVDKSWNSLGHLVEEVIERNAYGQPTQLKNIDAVVTNISYTPFGRSYLTYLPTGAWSHTRSINCESGCPAGAAYAVHSVQAGGRSFYGYYDLLGRMIEERKLGFSGETVTTQTEYNAIGRTHRQSTPHYNNSERYWAETRHDILGRPVKTLSPHQNNPIETTHVYTGFTTLTTVSSNNTNNGLISGSTETHTQVSNALGEIMQVTDALNGQVAYQFNALGKLLTTTTTAHTDGGGVASGNVPSTLTIALFYDFLGRKTAMHDPDKGNWTYSYNGFGELIAQIDAKGNSTKMSFDALGRQVVREDWLNLGGDPNSLDLTLENNTVWLYDQSGAGRLDEVRELAQADAYTQVYSHDGFGRQIASETSHGSNSYNTSVTFDQYGRLDQKLDASGNNQGVGYHYTSTGYLASAYEAKAVNGEHQTYFTIESMTARNQVSQVQWGNGAVSNRYYDPARGTPEQLITVAGLYVVQDLALDFDDFGNLVSRHNQGMGLAANTVGGSAKSLLETFQYDKLNRLLTSTLNGDTANAQALNYDSFGNIETKSDVGTYGYGESLACGSVAANDNFAGPHAVTSIDTGSGTEAYCFDRNGNLTADTTEDGGRSLTYSSFDKPTKINKGNHSIAFNYAPNRSRYKRIDTNNNNSSLNKTTYYMGNVERIEHADGSVEHKRYIEGQVLVTGILVNINATEPTSSKIQYLIKDYLGSTALVLNHSAPNGGFVAADMSFDAWGKRRKADNLEPMTFTELLNYMAGTVKDTTNKGFTGHEQLDEVGLIHMNGRIYDPRLGRFAQADPFIQSSSYTQSYNRYSYVMNNPLAATDPSGYFSLKKHANILGGLHTVLLGDAIGGALLREFHIFAHTNRIVNTVAIVVACAYGGPWGCAGAQAYSSRAMYGASHKEANKTFAQSVAVGYLFNGFGGAGQAGSSTGSVAANYAAKVIVNGVIGGIAAELQGGKFGHGFAAAGASAGVGMSLQNSGYSTAVRGAISTIAGGTISQATGGKFSNGAVTAAMSFAFNAMRNPQSGPHAGHEHSGAGGNPNPDGITFEKMENGEGAWEQNFSDTYHQKGVDPAFPNTKWNNPYGHEEVFDYNRNPVRDHNGPTFNRHQGNLNPLHVIDIIDWKANGTGWPADNTTSSDRCVIINC